MKPKKPERRFLKDRIRKRRIVTNAAKKVLKRERDVHMKHIMMKRAEKYLNVGLSNVFITELQEYRKEKRREVNLKRDAKRAGNFYVPAEPRLAFVVRIRGINGIHPKPRKILQLFRLRQINNGVFIRLNKVFCSCLPFYYIGYSEHA